MERFAKYSNFYLIDFLIFLKKNRKSVEKMTYQKKIRGHWMSNIVKSMQSHSNGHLPLGYYCSLYNLAYTHGVNFVHCKDARMSLSPETEDLTFYYKVIYYASITITVVILLYKLLVLAIL